MRVRFTHVAAASLLAIACTGPAHAADLDIVAGRSATTGHRWTTSVFVDVAADRIFDWRGLHFRPVATAGWIEARDTRRQHLDHDVFVGGAGLRLVHWWRGAFASFQVGVAGGRTDALSSAGQFISSVGWQGRHWVVMVRHISNGDLFGGRNLGETMLMAGVRF